MHSNYCQNTRFGLPVVQTTADKTTPREGATHPRLMTTPKMVLANGYTKVTVIITIGERERG